MLVPIVLIVLGALAAATFVVAKRPDAKVLLDKVTPFQGVLGVVAAVWGAWQLIQLVIHISLIKLAPVSFLVGTAMVLLTVALGFLMGYALIVKYALSKNAEAAAKGEAVRAKLVTYQTPLGLAGMAVGVVGLVMTIVR
jgi:hypothetical protein